MSFGVAYMHMCVGVSISVEASRHWKHICMYSNIVEQNNLVISSRF